MRVIYTSLDGFSSKKCEVKNYTELTDDFVEWVNEKSVQLLINRNEAELKDGEELRKITSDVNEQVFFMMSGHSYFLDYFLPRYKIAIEIDGAYHKDRLEEDKKRDLYFSNIGIRTIRIKARDVMRGNFLKELELSLKTTKTKKNKHKNKKKSKAAEELKAARKRLREHDKMKYNSKWI